MGNEDRISGHDSGLINMRDLIRASRPDENFDVELCEMENAIYSVDAVIYETRARLRNSCRGLLERNFAGAMISGVFIPAVDGRKIFIEDKKERMKDAEDGCADKVKPVNNSLDTKRLCSHEEVRYLRDKFRFYLMQKKYDLADNFAKRSADVIKDEQMRAEFIKLVGYAVEDALLINISINRSDLFTEMFFAINWEKYLRTSVFGRVDQHVISGERFKSDIRKALIRMMEERGAAKSHEFRRLLKRLGLYLS